MRAALAVARRGLGLVWPNPAVGCVLVRPDLGGRVVGRGWTQPGGRPHAETEALARAGDAARGATAYVTLEPCAHHGETPPCADALIAAGIGRAVVALDDPDPRVGGRGLSRLREAGIPVSVGICEDEAAGLNAGFLLRQKEGRPLFTLKSALSLDGRIALASGTSKWITGEVARAHAHRLRDRHDGVMIGIGTALADDPELTCRLPGGTRRPSVRIVVDSRLRLPSSSRLVRGAGEIPTWVIAAKGVDPERGVELTDRGATVIEVASGSDGRPLVAEVARELAKRGLTRVLVEGGGELAASLLRAGLVDRLVCFRAPRVIGGDGIAAIGDLGREALAETSEFVRTDVRAAGVDLLEFYRRRD